MRLAEIFDLLELKHNTQAKGEKDERYDSGDVEGWIGNKD